MSDADLRIEKQEVKELDLGTKLAIDRTRVAYERTMLAWIRTAASLITFGFGVWKFFDIEKPEQRTGGVIGPHTFGLILVGIGLASLVLAALEQRQGIRELRQMYKHNKRVSMAVIVGMLVAGLGIFTFVGMLIRRL